MVYFGAVDREWAPLTGFVNHQIEKLGKQGLSVAEKADNTCDSIGMLSPSEKQTGNYAHCLCIWIVKGADHYFCPLIFGCSPQEFTTFCTLQYFGEL